MANILRIPEVRILCNSSMVETRMMKEILTPWPWFNTSRILDTEAIESYLGEPVAIRTPALCIKADYCGAESKLWYVREVRVVDSFQPQTESESIGV